MLSAARNCLILAFLFASSCGGEQTGDARSSRQFLAKFPRQTATPGPSTPVPSPTTSTLSNPLSTYAPCIYYSSVLSSCENATTSFNQLNPAQQATCLCYTGSTSWAPASLYSAVVDCANVASNVAPSRYPYFSSLVDHCSSSRFVISSASLPLAGVSGVLTTANDTQTPAVTSSREPTAGISGSSTSGLFTRTSTTTSYSSRPTTNSSTSTGNTPGVADLTLSQKNGIIAVGVIVGCILLVVLLLYCLRHSRRHRGSDFDQEDIEDEESSARIATRQESQIEDSSIAIVRTQDNSAPEDKEEEPSQREESDDSEAHQTEK